MEYPKIRSFYDYDNKLVGIIKFGSFLDKLRIHYLLRKISCPWS
jgi:hypothetical protein